ncbi:flagellar hook-basal body complex protein FliE [Parapedomonas caeni]
MSIRALDAANAYAQSLGRTSGGPLAESGGLDAPAGSAGSAFGQMLGDMFTSAVDATKHSEVMAARSVAGKADLVDVVTAVNSAEMAVETLVAVRDRVISAYQEIMRMPI